MKLTNRTHEALLNLVGYTANVPRAEEYVIELVDALLEDPATMALIENRELEMFAAEIDEEPEEPEEPASQAIYRAPEWWDRWLDSEPPHVAWQSFWRYPDIWGR